MDIISKTNLWLIISAVFIIASIVLLAAFGLKLGIDFTGGSLLEVNYLSEMPGISAIQEKINPLSLGAVNMQPVGASGLILRLKNINEDEHQAVLKALESAARPEENNTSEGADEKAEDKDTGLRVENSGAGSLQVVDVNGLGFEQSGVLEELRFDSVGPSIGEELKEKSFYAAIIVLILIVAYIAYAFRKVSKPVASWKYGLSAIAALFHDVLVVLGVFAVLGKFMDVEIDTAFIAAILTVLGYSVNDTIVVFDRIRENLPKSEKDFGGTVNDSLNQTIGRSVNTSLTTLLVLLALLFWGGETIHYFVLALVIGIAAGTYSSIFLASPLLVFWEKRQKT